MSTTVVRSGTLWTGGAAPRTLADHDLVIVDGVVATIEPRFAGRADTEIDATGCLVVPGLINAHVHAGCTPHIRGITEDTPIPADRAYYHSLDLIQDLRFAAMLGKIRQQDSGRPNALTVLRCATHGAARALARPDLGHLEPGARGDAAVIDLATPFNSPVFDPIRSLVYYSNARDIRCTLVDGRPITRDGQVLGVDMAALRMRAHRAASRLWALTYEQGIALRDRS